MDGVTGVNTLGIIWNHVIVLYVIPSKVVLACHHAGVIIRLTIPKFHNLEWVNCLIVGWYNMSYYSTISTGLEHFGTWLSFFHSVGNVIIPTDFHMFQDG